VRGYKSSDGSVESELAKLWVSRRLGPRVLAWDTEHGGHGVIAKCDDGLLMLAARAGDVHVTLDEDVMCVRHGGPRNSSGEESADGGRLRKGCLQYSRWTVMGWPCGKAELPEYEMRSPAARFTT
jgi:hypothetical protein